MSAEVKVIEDSISLEGKRITTFQLKYWRAIHSEFMTHRVFSRNASSSRAIPVSKMIQQVRENPAGPIHWGKNQAGMQASEEITGYSRDWAMQLWKMAAHKAANYAEDLMHQGVHKQVVNRILEPYQWIHVVVTATEWDNFFSLRAHPDAQPEIQDLAFRMQLAMEDSKPDLLNEGEWHLPYLTPKEKYNLDTDLAKQVSAARCCRVSYLKHDGSQANVEEDLALCKRLAGSQPIHASPFEHQATPDSIVPDSLKEMAHWKCKHLQGNFNGWIQYRKLIEEEFN